MYRLLKYSNQRTIF